MSYEILVGDQRDERPVWVFSGGGGCGTVKLLAKERYIRWSYLRGFAFSDDKVTWHRAVDGDIEMISPLDPK